MLYIAGGAWKGKALKQVQSKNLRPTSTKVKASIFNILFSYRMKLGLPTELSGVRCLDMYAGVGGLGLEALSYGADHCIFVEKERMHCKVLGQNIAVLQCESRSFVMHSDVRRAWHLLEKQSAVDYIFLDPPYKEDHSELLAKIAQHVPMQSHGMVLFEHDPSVEIAVVPGFALHSVRKIGPAGLSVFTCAK